MVGGKKKKRKQGSGSLKFRAGLVADWAKIPFSPVPSIRNSFNIQLVLEVNHHFSKGTQTGGT